MFHVDLNCKNIEKKVIQLIVNVSLSLFFFPAERRPLKSSTQVPLFRSPSARLVQHDKLLADDAYRGSDGSIVCSLGGMNNKEVHHYTFQPSKQIVSNLFELQPSQFNVIGHLSETPPFIAICVCGVLCDANQLNHHRCDAMATARRGNDESSAIAAPLPIGRTLWIQIFDKKIVLY